MNCSTGLSSIDLPEGDFSDPPMPLPDELPNFPTLPNKPTVVCFGNAACADVKLKRKPTTGCATFSAGGAFACRSKTQMQTALSSAEAKFHATVSAAEIVCCMQFVLNNSHFTQQNPAITCKDDQSTKKIANAIAPTEQTSHVSTSHFAISVCSLFGVQALFGLGESESQIPHPVLQSANHSTSNAHLKTTNRNSVVPSM